MSFTNGLLKNASFTNQSLVTATKPKIAFIDDEARILRSLKMHFRDSHDVFTTTEPDELLDYLKHNDVQVVISDQRMPKKLGVDVLKDVKSISPHTIRILLTGYADLNAVVNAINEGEIFRYITKPWQTDELKNVVNQATDIAIQTKAVIAEQPDENSQAKLVDHITKRRILVIDDHEEVYLQMKQRFTSFEVHWANTLEQALILLQAHRFGVAITDITLGSENISPIIYTLKQHYPDLAVMVLTEFSDAHSLIHLINKGQVYRYLPRPTNLSMLDISLQRAFAYHEQLVAQPKLQIRHTVAEISDSEKLSFTDKIKSFFSRFGRAPKAAST